MLRYFIFFTVVLFSLPTYSSDSVQILGRNIELIDLNSIKYSEKCFKSCLARDAVEAYMKKPYKLAPKVKFLSGKGSVLCRDYWKQVSLLGIKQDKSQSPFCLFSDQSLVDLQSVSNKLRKD